MVERCAEEIVRSVTWNCRGGRRTRRLFTGCSEGTLLRRGESSLAAISAIAIIGVWSISSRWTSWR